MDVMMLGALDIALIVATALIATALVMGLTLVALRVNRRRSIASQFALVVAGAVLSIVAATAAVMVEMYVSPHDLTVFLWVVGVSALVSLTAAWLIIRRMTRTSTDALIASAQQVGEGAVVEADRPGWREFDDVSAQLAETSEKLAAARDEIAKLDDARRQFLAWISHDLRTPLTGIRALADALEDGLGPDPAAAADRIRGRVDALDHMVDDLFRLSKLETGTLALTPELVPLLDVVSDAVADVHGAAEAREIRIVPAGIDGHMLWADPRELSRAIGNLLANAVRHAPDGTDIVIDAALRAPTSRTMADSSDPQPGSDPRTGRSSEKSFGPAPRDTRPRTMAENSDPRRDSDPRNGRSSEDSARSLVISVMDHGSGVASEDLGRIFDVGWRASGSRDAEGGAGLGLAIVRGIVEAHGGEVGADNLDDGFVVTVALPARD